MVKKILLITVALLSLAFSFRADTGTVMGKVKNKMTGALIPLVSFTLEQEGTIKYKTETDFEGRYKIEKVVPGTYTVKLQVQDHQTKQVNGFVVKANIINFLDVDMEKEKPLTKKEIKAMKKKNRKEGK